MQGEGVGSGEWGVGEGTMSSSPFPTPHSLFPARCSCPLKSPMLRFAAIITLHQFNPISFEHFGLGGLRAKETLYCEEGL